MRTLVIKLRDGEYEYLRREAFELRTKMATLARARIFAGAKIDELTPEPVGGTDDRLKRAREALERVEEKRKCGGCGRGTGEMHDVTCRHWRPGEAV